MVKKIRFQEIRSQRRRRTEPQGSYVLEPADLALLGLALLSALVFVVSAT